MSLSYDGSLLYHLAAHMPLHCIIIVAPPSCHFVLLACCCLLCCLCRLHLCCASLFWLMLCSPPSLASSRRHCQKEPTSPYAPLQTCHVLHLAPLVRPLVLLLCRLVVAQHVAFVAGVFAVVVPMPTPSSHWHHCCCCAGIFAIVAANTAVIYCCCQTNLRRTSLVWLIVVFTAHCRGDAADDKK